MLLFNRVKYLNNLTLKKIVKNIFFSKNVVYIITRTYKSMFKEYSQKRWTEIK